MFLMTLLATLKAFDLKTWFIIGLVAVSLTLWVMIQLQSNKIQSLKNEVGQKELIIDQYKTNVATLTNAVEDQNKAIEDMATKNKEFIGALDDANEQNLKLNQNAKALIKLINNSYVPPDCQGAVGHLEQFTQQHAGEWNK